MEGTPATEGQLPGLLRQYALENPGKETIHLKLEGTPPHIKVLAVDGKPGPQAGVYYTADLAQLRQLKS